MKHHPMATANAAGATTAIIYVVCRLLVGAVPNFMFSMAQSWFHGIALSRMAAWNLSTSTFFLGLVSTTVSAWLVGWVFASLYNYFLKK